MKKIKLTALERSWILYDIGNSAFILLVSTLIPIYFNALATTGGLNESLYLSYWGYAGSVSTLLVAVIGPICGTLADHRGFKKPIFMACMLLGVLGCAAMGVTAGWLAFLVVFVLAKVGYSSSLVFYDAMLPEVTTDERMNTVSSMGYAYGYIGSVIPFILCLLLVQFGDKIGAGAGTAMVVSFLITAVWWFVCTQPLLKRYRQTAFVEHGGNPVSSTFRRLRDTFREVRQQKHIFLYLLAFFFFIDGVYTIIDMATAYGTALGLNTTGLLLTLLLTQFVAFPCSIAFGRFSAKYDTGLLIKICILCYTGITLFAVFLVFQWQFWVLAVLVGMFQGGIQALSRSMFGKLIPDKSRSGEFFGFFDIFGKFSSIMGPALVGVVSSVVANGMLGAQGLTAQTATAEQIDAINAQSSHYGILSIIIIIIVGAVLYFGFLPKAEHAKQ